MNVYDFDKTIYAGNSTLNFYFYCLRKNPKIVIYIPRQIEAAMNYKLRKIDKTQFKAEFYSFFNKLDNMEDIVKEFWDKNEHKIKKWYVEVQKEDDVIISASPYFLLEEICRRVKIHNLIASEVDMKTGKYTGINCYGEEKVKRFYGQYKSKIENFYSDSRSDQPMADIAKNSFIVKGDMIIPW